MCRHQFPMGAIRLSLISFTHILIYHTHVRTAACMYMYIKHYTVLRIMLEMAVLDAQCDIHVHVCTNKQ